MKLPVFTRFSLTFFFAAALFVLSSCSSTTETVEPEAAPEELANSLGPLSDTPEGELFQTAKRHFEVGLYSVSRTSFETLRDSYPVGAFSEFAEIKAADSYFEASEYDAAAVMYEELLKNRPASEAVPYLLLRTARSYQLANNGVGRDTAPLVKSLQFYGKLLTQYPNSPYSEGAEALKKQVEEVLAAYEKEVIEFYKKQGKETAVQARSSEFESKWGQPFEKFEYVEAQSMPQEQIGEAPEGSRVLFETTIASAGETSPAVSGEPARAQKAVSFNSASSIRLVECDRDQNLVLIHLSRLPEKLETITSQNPVQERGGMMRFSLIQPIKFEGSYYERSCFGDNDLRILKDGTVELKRSGSEGELITLDNPPRIMLALTAP